MGTYSARALAALLGHTEKTIRARLVRGAYPGAYKVNATLWAIPDEAITSEISVPSLARRVDQLETDNHALQARLSALESGLRSVTRYKDQETALLTTDDHVYSYIPTTAVHRDGAAILARFNDRSSAAKWLALHGANYHTARRWDDLPLEPRAALAFAQDHLSEIGYRARGSALHACDNTSCLCQSLWYTRKGETWREP